MKKLTQNDRILHYLRMTYTGLCAMEPLDWTPPITRVAARIYNLKKQGWRIDSKARCPKHKGANHAWYTLSDDRLTPTPGDNNK